MGLIKTLAMGSVTAAAFECLVNDALHVVTSRPKKVCKSIERRGKIIRMTNSLERELERIEDEAYSPAVELHLKLVAFNTVLAALGRTMSREELYAERELRRRGKVGPIFAMAKQEQRLADLYEEYLLNG